jgi:Fe-S cluster biosynthesis and repair protein YggX
MVAAMGVEFVHGAHGQMHQARARRRGARLFAVSGRTRQAHLRQRVEEAWRQWLEQQKMLVNENQLNLADKKARDYLVQQMDKYFFGSGADVAAGYTPPLQK